MSGTGVKICGVRDPEDARLAVALGARYIGINFFAGSPRCIEAAEARRIREAVAGGASLVGVVVGADSEEVARLVRDVPLDYVQFHGDEPWSAVEPFADRAIKVFRLGEAFDAEVMGEFEACWGFLFDTLDAASWGGTGRSFDHRLLEGLSLQRPAFLAGGVGPANARHLRRRFPDFHLDVCSSIERAPGVKDRELMQELFAEVRHGET